MQFGGLKQLDDIDCSSVVWADICSGGRVCHDDVEKTIRLEDEVERSLRRRSLSSNLSVSSALSDEDRKTPRLKKCKTQMPAFFQSRSFPTEDAIYAPVGIILNAKTNLSRNEP